MDSYFTSLSGQRHHEKNHKRRNYMVNFFSSLEAFSMSTDTSDIAAVDSVSSEVSSSSSSLPFPDERFIFLIIALPDFVSASIVAAHPVAVTPPPTASPTGPRAPYMAAAAATPTQHIPKNLIRKQNL